MLTAVVSATHRPGSFTRRVSVYVARRLQEERVSYHFIDFRTLPTDFLFSDAFGARSDTFLPVIESLAECYTWLWVVPEYNGSFPGIVKVFIDNLPREVLRGKRAGLIGVSDGKFGNLRGLEHLTGILHYCGMEVIPFRAHLMHVSQRWNEELGMPDEAHRTEIEILLQQAILVPQGRGA
ncbi:MAG: NAD(P)H-dependent oxidoreductase [Bacteroidia bacterium]|nr:NAD(P)H-dependent oxidoreductase [Bacteroidia bacterium]MDW8236225.1 NAD(P)H-dependent oxidoreductase [Bacteroidia bacterium]